MGRSLGPTVPGHRLCPGTDRARIRPCPDTGRARVPTVAARRPPPGRARQERTAAAE
ncbi:hypothetical protein KPATCC21470_0293 [Kitasatospora purpeofusca]